MGPKKRTVANEVLLNWIIPHSRRKLGDWIGHFVSASSPLRAALRLGLIIGCNIRLLIPDRASGVQEEWIDFVTASVFIIIHRIPGSWEGACN